MPAAIRPIRSFVRREGRMTPKQTRALDLLWPQYGLEPTGCLNFSEIFNNSNPCVLEIGFGMGDSLAAMAVENPLVNFIGIEVHRPGLGALLHQIKELGLKNLRLINVDASDILKHYIKISSLDGLQIYFPDPWPKKRHHKRRIIQPGFVALAAMRLKPKGLLHLATDWQPYAEHMEAVMDQSAIFRQVSEDRALQTHSRQRCTTKFERRGLRLGHGITDLYYIKEQ